LTVDSRQFSLYVHIPYCASKCPYCDFNSYAAARWPESEYVAALVGELAHAAGHEPWRNGRVATIFFGGGTPSLFTPESIAEVLAAVRRQWPVTKSRVESSELRVDSGTVESYSLTLASRLSTVNSEIETTLEANPGTVTRDTLRAFRAAGINRVSFGVQSFTPRHLTRLGRVHDADEAVAAVRLARQAGFDNVNLDLIFAVPGQTLSEWEADLDTAVALAPDHLSVYSLTYEEGTAFHAMRRHGQLVPVPEEIELAMFTQAQERLGAAGYRQYEISNYARRGYECRHNLNYWRGGEYLGIGAGAHSFARTPVAGRRWSNEKDPNVYMRRVQVDGHAQGFEEALSERQARGEFVFLGLRCLDGLDTRAFAERFGVDFVTAFPHSETLRSDGLLAADDRRWSLTSRGLLVADSVFATFI